MCLSVITDRVRDDNGEAVVPLRQTNWMVKQSTAAWSAAGDAQQSQASMLLEEAKQCCVVQIQELTFIYICQGAARLYC